MRSHRVRCVRKASGGALLISLWMLQAFSILSLNGGALAGGESRLRDPGVPSSIRKVFVISHSHTDIGFDATPEAMKDLCKEHIDAQIAYAREHPDFKWVIEQTWNLENWIQRSSEEEVVELMDRVRAGQIAVMGAHTTPRSGRLGVEEMNRLLWNARRYREKYDIPIDTVMHNDVPGANWCYPQVLARSGIKYLVCGMNTGLFGPGQIGFDQPYRHYLFYWEGPDGSRVLTHSTLDAYVEGWVVYGLPWGLIDGPIGKEKLSQALNTLTEAGYPYDAVLVQNAADAKISQVEREAIRIWNSTCENPEFILCTPDEFFEHMETKYKGQIPVVRGNMTSIWDIHMPTEPRGQKIVKNAQDLIPAYEKMCAIAWALGLGDYPHSVFDHAWDMMLTVDEHAEAGQGWPGYFTQEQTDDSNKQYWDYALSCLASASEAKRAALDSLLGVAAVPESDSVVVFNPLSWTRTDIVRVPASEALMKAEFFLRDAASGAVVPHQKDPDASEILFIARDVPSIGYKRLRIVLGRPPETGAGSLCSRDRIVENDQYRLEVGREGYIISLEDKVASRELVSAESPLDFNGLILTSDSDKREGRPRRIVRHSDAVAIAPGMQGPVAAGLSIHDASYPVVVTEITLYDGVDRIDVANTIDQHSLEHCDVEAWTKYYAFTFPFALKDYTARLDTAAGWLNPACDTIPGAYTGAHVIQHGMDLSEADYGVMLGSPDVYTHSFGGFETAGGGYPPAEPTFASTFIRYGDEALLRGHVVGSVHVEPGADPRWELRYSFKPHRRGFSPSEEARFGWEVASPLQAKEVPAGKGRLPSDSVSFFALDNPDVIITDIKKADFGPGIIVKLQEVAGKRSRVKLRSDFFQLAGAWATTPLEEDLHAVELAGPQEIAFEMGAAEISTLRLLLARPRS